MFNQRCYSADVTRSNVEVVHWPGKSQSNIATWESHIIQ